MYIKISQSISTSISMSTYVCICIHVHAPTFIDIDDNHMYIQIFLGYRYPTRSNIFENIFLYYMNIYICTYIYARISCTRA